MVVAAAGVAGLLAGCQNAHVATPLTHTVGGNDPGEQLEFWHQLAEQPVTSNDDAFHGLLMFVDGDDPAQDYAGRVAALTSRGMLPKGFNKPAEEAVERGTLAVAIVKALGIKGGLMLRLLGPTPRYAVRELVFMDLYPPSSPHQTFSGNEFLGIIGKIEDYEREQAAGSRAGPERETEGPPLPEPHPEQPTPRPTRPRVQPVAPAAPEAGGMAPGA